MSDWRVRRLYGFGVGQLRLAPHPAGLIHRPVSARTAFLRMVEEIGARSRAAQVRTALRAATVAGLAAVLLVAVRISDRIEEPVDTTDLKIVWLDIPEPQPHRPPPIAPVPAPSSEPVEVVTEIAQRAEIPERPTPVVAKPVRPELPPVEIPDVAEIALAEPVRVAPEPERVAPRPDVRFAELAPSPTPESSAPPRASRVARERPLAAAQKPVRVDPVAQRSLPRPATATPRRADVSRPSLARASSRAPVSLAVATVSVSAPAHVAAAGNARSKTPARTAVFRPQSARRSVAPAALSGTRGSPGMQARTAGFATPQASARTSRSEPAFSSGYRSEPDAPLEGVPLSALAACLTDREEDRLKLGVLERVSRPTECVSPAGRYRFVETKNLNAFLMWIERSPRRAATDRCGELRLAIDCLDTDPMYGGST